ncbi:hypothetical protein GUF79_10885, partial [Xanthomonas citri pv. citri]|nr:hypothetical protein [Xanthomonas citri pv. citri]
LTTINHKIHTPLYNILNTLKLLKLTTLNNQQKNYLNTIQRSSSTLIQLINNILNISKTKTRQLILKPILFSPTKLT